MGLHVAESPGPSEFCGAQRGAGALGPQQGSWRLPRLEKWLVQGEKRTVQGTWLPASLRLTPVDTWDLGPADIRGEFGSGEWMTVLVCGQAL